MGARVAQRLHGRRLLRSTAASAYSAIAMHWGTSILLTATVAVCIAVLLPIATLGGTADHPLDSHLVISTIRGGNLGLPWTLDAQSPAQTQQRAIGLLFSMLTGVGVATLGSFAVTVVALCGSRAASRSVELVVRRAVGASRRTLWTAALLEAGMLAVPAMAAGVYLGTGLTRLAVGEWSGTVTHAPTTMPVVLGTILVSLLVVGTLLPIVFARRGRLVDAEPEPRAIFGPAVLQLAVSLAVLTTSALVGRHAAGVADGGRSRGAGTVLELSTRNARADELSGRYAAMLHLSRVSSRRASLASPGALMGLGTISSVMTDCGDCSEGGIPLRFKMFYATHLFVSPDSFEALGLRVVAGRALALSDRWGSPRVAVVNRALATRHFQRAGAIGRPMIVGVDRHWYTVVGIVDGPPPSGFGSRFQPPYTVYLSILQHPVGEADLLMSPQGGPQAPFTGGGDVLAVLRPMATQVVMTSESRLFAAEAAPLEWFARWIGVQGWAALASAAVGMFVVMRLWVLSLMPELGIRRALGANRTRLLALVCGQAAAVAFVGVAAGLWFGWAVWSVLPTIMVGAATWDTGAIVKVAAVLIVATLAGALFPALSAMRASPARLMSDNEG
jgi:putative ABC transport system permease protein